MLISICNYKKTSTYKFIKDVIDISEPLKKLGIINFYYVELMESEGLYYIGGLVNNDQMMRAFIKNDGLNYEPALSPHKIIKPGFYPISAMVKSKTTKTYYNKNFMYGGTSDEIVFITDDKNIRKIYIFGLLGSSYINRSHLEMFILYFDDKARHLINQLDRHKIPNKFVGNCSLSRAYPKASISWQTEQEFLNSINAKHYMTKKLQEQYFLSQRESQCLELILQNKLSKEIAYTLGLNKRTIDDYIGNLKKKLSCRTKQELILKIL